MASPTEFPWHTHGVCNALTVDLKNTIGHMLLKLEEAEPIISNEHFWIKNLNVTVYQKGFLLYGRMPFYYLPICNALNSVCSCYV